MNTDAHRLNELTHKVIGCAYKVGNVLGCGFREKVYENAMVHEFRKAGLKVEPQKQFTIYYDGAIVGEYCADIVVEDLVIIEIKAVKAFDEVHSAQCLNYLLATGLPVCLLINFGRTKVDVKRFAGKGLNELDLT